MSRPRIHVDREVLTPKQAQEWLDAYNTSNRRPKDRKIAQIAGDMQRGQFNGDNGETIKLGDMDGEVVLLDGQCRLMALASLNGRTRQAFWIVRGLPLEAQETMDLGTARTVGDILTLRGHSYASIQAAIARGYLGFQESGSYQYGGPRSVSAQQQVDLVENDPRVLRAAQSVSHLWNTDRLPVPGALAGTLMLVFAEASDWETAEQFFTEVAQDGAAGNPAAVLRRRLLRGKGTANALPRTMVAPFTIKAWNAWITGERVSALRWRPRGPKPENYPKVQQRVD